MTPFNRIAVYGHRGWASSAIVDALISSGASVKVLHRPGSETSRLPNETHTVEVDVKDQDALVGALQDTDIVISLVGHHNTNDQYALIRSIARTKVGLFVPSDLSYKTQDVQMQVPALKAKTDVLHAAQDAGIPFTVIWPGNLVESTFASTLVGIDHARNRMVYSGDSKNQPLNLCTRKYVAAAYVSIFARTPIEKLANRFIGLSEFTCTGNKIAESLQRRHGKPPQVFEQSLETIDREIKTRLKSGDWTALAFAYRYAWGSGQQVKLVGDDIWEVEGYKKTTLNEVLVEGNMEPYKQLPPQFIADLYTTFF